MSIDTQLAHARMNLRLAKEWRAHPSAIAYWKMHIDHLTSKKARGPKKKTKARQKRRSYKAKRS